jgi:hypothetical protein
MQQPCDEGVVLSGKPASPCGPQAQAWILAATILTSSMAFIDNTVVNVALPALQSSLQATVVGVQWAVESYVVAAVGPGGDAICQGRSACSRSDRGLHCEDGAEPGLALRNPVVGL